VYIDTAILIYSVEGYPDYRELLHPLWLKLKASELEVISSELSLMEVLIVPIRNNDPDLVNYYEQLMLEGRYAANPHQPNHSQRSKVTEPFPSQFFRTEFPTYRVFL
jgi:predicted nucleic acid-binding protein